MMKIITTNGIYTVSLSLFLFLIFVGFLLPEQYNTLKYKYKIYYSGIKPVCCSYTFVLVILCITKLPLLYVLVAEWNLKIDDKGGTKNEEDDNDDGGDDDDDEWRFKCPEEVVLFAVKVLEQMPE